MLRNRFVHFNGYSLASAALVMLLLAILPSQNMAAAGIVKNGDFSANAAAYTAFPGYSASPNPNAPTGWSGVNGVNGPDTGFYKTTTNNMPFAPAHSGRGIRDFAFVQGTGNYVSQRITTIPNHKYILDYYGAARAGETSDILKVIVTNALNGRQIVAQIPPIINKKFTRFRLRFIAPSAATKIEFLNASASGSSGTVDVTNVTLAVAKRVPTQPRLAAARPRAVVGVYYFDGWARQGDSHLTGLLTNPAYANREPLSGWLDNTPHSVAQQLAWAHRDGISFFVFDWYYHHGTHPSRLNNALRQYQTLRKHSGVHYALLDVNIGQFAISQKHWRHEVTRWVRHYFTQKDYQRINGQPVLVIIDMGRFARQFAGYDGAHGRVQSVNHALAVLQKVAKAHGLPGVYVVGGVLWGSAYPHIRKFPTFSWLRGVHVDALSEYNYPYGGGVFNGPRSYRYLMRFGQWAWARYAAVSPHPYIPVVMDGWDPRPWNERIDGKLVWYKRTPAEFEEFVHAAIRWEKHHPAMRVAPPPHRPVLLIEAWNELGEGSYMVPTIGDHNAYGNALAQALGLTVVNRHKHNR